MLNGAISIIREYQAGKLYKFNGYNAYVPNNYSENTPVMYYLCGDGGQSAYETPFAVGGNFDTEFREKNAQSIVIQVPRNVDYDPDTKTRISYLSGQQANIYVEDIKKNLGLSGNMTVAISHSGSAGDASIAALKLLASNKDESPPIINVVMDGYIPASYWKSTGYIEKFKENNSIFLLFAQNQTTTTAKNYYPAYLQLASQGVNTIIFEDNANEEGRPRSHTEMSNAFTEVGIYDYLSSNGTIDFSQFKSIRAFINGQEIALDLSKIDNINKLYSFFGIDTSKYHLATSFSNLELSKLKNFSLESDKNHLSTSLNRIRAAIRKTSYLTTNLSNQGFSSTTQVPTQINTCITNYFNNVTTILTNIAKLTDSVAEIHENYVKCDEKLTKEVTNK